MKFLNNLMFGQNLLSFRKKGGTGRLVGLDIGSYCIKALEFNLTRTGREIKNLVKKELPSELRGGKRDPAALVKEINSCLSEGNISTRDVVIMVSGPQVFIRRITLPPIPEEELAEAVLFEAAKHGSFPLEKLAADYIITGKKEVKGVTNLDILLVAIPKEVIENLISVIRAAGLKPIAVTVAPVVLWKSFQLSNQVSEGKVIAMLDIGFEKTTISLLNNGVLEFTRTINLAGGEITKVMTVPFVMGDGNLRTLSYNEAETIKRKYGFPPSSKTGTTEEGIPFNQLLMLMSPVLEKILDEVRASLDFYQTEFQIPKVDKIIMSGGTAALKGLKEFLAGELGIEAEPANPFQGARFAEKIPKDHFINDAPAFVIPFGLASWGKNDLSVLAQRKSGMGLKTFKSLAIPCGVAILIIICLYWSVSNKLAETRVELMRKTQELASLNHLSAATIALSATKKKLEAEINSLPEALKHSIDTARVLEAIRLSTPDNTRLVQIRVIPQEGKKLIQIWGTAFFLDERGTAMSGFMATLEDSPLFHDVRMLSVGEDKNYTVNGLRFQISCQYSAITP